MLVSRTINSIIQMSLQQEQLYSNDPEQLFFPYRYLLSANAPLEEEDTFGNTPLINAAERGVTELVAMLLSR